MRPSQSWLPALLVLGMQLPASTAAQAPTIQRVQQRECSQRVGPFATQDSAWQRLRQAQGQGYGTSGVFPCYDGYGSRGYCFNVFATC